MVCYLFGTHIPLGKHAFSTWQNIVTHGTKTELNFILPWFEAFQGVWRQAVDGEIGPALVVADGDREAAEICPDDVQNLGNGATFLGAFDAEHLAKSLKFVMQPSIKDFE